MKKRRHRRPFFHLQTLASLFRLLLQKYLLYLILKNDRKDHHSRIQFVKHIAKF